MHLTANDFTRSNDGSKETAFPCPRVRVTIEQDSCPGDPFEDHDGHWPMVVRESGQRKHRWHTTIKVEIGRESPATCTQPLVNWFSPEGLVHNQREIYKALGIGDKYLRDNYETIWLVDADDIVAVIEDHDPGMRENDLEAVCTILTLAEVKHYRETVRGYCQSDFADVLILAPKETIAKLRGGALDDAYVLRDMKSQAQLYADWAYGNVHGYVIEILPPEISDPEDVIEEDWEEVEDGSCWGYYGDHDRSGILDAINEVLSYEPVASMIAAHARCEAGMHSWVDDPRVWEPDHLCAHCREPYGCPEGVSDNLTQVAA